MARAKVTIDGRDVTADVANIDDFVLYVRKNSESAVVGEELSDNLQITGESYEWLRSIFYDDCENYDTLLRATFETDICDGIKLDLFLTGENIVLNPCECRARIPFKSFNEEQCCYQELDATEWYSDGFCEQYTFPMVWYANQPSFLQYILLRLRQLVIAATTILAAGIIAGAFFNAGGAALVAGAFFILRNALLEDIDTWLSGTGRVLPAPLLRDVFEYQAQKCGLQFSSSIWQNPSSPYYNEVIVYAEAGKFLRPEQIEDQELVCEVFLANAANISTIELLQLYAEKFDAEFEIIDGVLYFEHRTFFENRDEESVVDLVQLCEDKIYEQAVEYEYNDQELYSGLRLSYIRDTFDIEGSKTNKIGIYKNNYGFTINNNSDVCKYNPNQFQTKRRDLQFSSPRFMKDVDTGANEVDSAIDLFRDGGSGGIVGFIATLFGINNTSPYIRESDLVMTSDFLYFPKTLILEDNFDFKDAQVKKRLANEEELEEYFAQDLKVRIKIDYAYKYNEDNQVTALFDRFHYYCDPNEYRGKLTLSSVDVPCSCELLRTILDKKTRTGILTHFGKAKAEEFLISFNSLQPKITITNLTIFCDTA